MAARIVHVTAHLGGGVGRVLKHLTAASQRGGRFRHEIYCLDYANPQAISWSKESGVPVHGDAAANADGLATAIQHADVVHLHWWNHPLIENFLDCWPLPPGRTAMWAHVSGYEPPHRIRDELLDVADRFVVATPYSCQVPAIARRSEGWRQTHLRSVFASAGYEHVVEVRPKAHRQFQIGYIGTVDYGKMHRDYLAMHSAADIPGAVVVVCGGMRHEELRQEANLTGVGGRFDIRGPVARIGEVLAVLDVFGYPLNERHYGASEVALVEAMVAGVVPVVWNNGCEREIVADGRTGIVAGNIHEYTRALEFLYRYPDVRRQMAAAARQDALERFPIARTVDQWHRVYDELLDLPRRALERRRVHPWPGGRERGTALFLNALSGTAEGDLFRRVLDDPEDDLLREQIAALPPVFHGHSNGSVRQYCRYFPEAAGLGCLERALDRSQLLHAAASSSKNAPAAVTVSGG